MTKEQLLQMARETMTLEAYSANHALNLNLQDDPIALQRWAVKAQGLIEELLKKGTAK